MLNSCIYHQIYKNKKKIIKKNNYLNIEMTLDCFRSQQPMRSWLSMCVYENTILPQMNFVGIYFKGGKVDFSILWNKTIVMIVLNIGG